MSDAQHEGPKTYRGKITGLRWEAERCPDSSSVDGLKAAVGGGAIGFVSGLLFGLAPQTRLLAAAAGAVIGHLASKYHLNLDWDPDSLFGDGGDEPPTPRPGSDDPNPRPL